jgi:hypothetical protein
MVAGAKITKREFNDRCEGCKRSTEPGWLWLGGGDWVECPLCNGRGYFVGIETRVEPTRKIFLPSGG